MGNSCCNNAKDEHAKDYGKPTKKLATDDPTMQELMKEAKKNEGKIVKLQAGWRGHQTRKNLKDEKEDNKNKPRASARLSQRNKDGSAAIAKPVDKLPDYSNQATRATEARLGKFNYDQPASPTDK